MFIIDGNVYHNKVEQCDHFFDNEIRRVLFEDSQEKRVGPQDDVFINVV